MTKFNAPDVADIEQRILNETVVANRVASCVVAVLLAACGAALLLTLSEVREVPFTSVITLWGVVGGLLACPLIILFRAPEDAYPVVRFWVGLVGLAIGGQVVNYLFGSERQYILETGWPPLLISGIPLFLIIARTFLIPRHAHFVQWLFLLSLAFASGMHWALFSAQADTLYGMGLLLVTIWFIGPLIVLLLDLQLRVQGTAYRRLQAELVDIQRKNDLQHQVHVLDELTGLLNADGIHDALELALASNESTGLARLRVSNAANILQFCGEHDYGVMLREISSALKREIGFQLSAGRGSNGAFFIWGKLSETSEQWDQRMADVAAAVLAEFADGHFMPEIDLESTIIPQGVAIELALQHVDGHGSLSEG